MWKEFIDLSGHFKEQPKRRAHLNKLDAEQLDFETKDLTRLIDWTRALTGANGVFSGSPVPIASRVAKESGLVWVLALESEWALVSAEVFPNLV
jgi:hypothetical protein